MIFAPEPLTHMLSSAGMHSFGSSILDMFDPDLRIACCTAFERSDPSQPPKVILSAHDGSMSDDLCQDLSLQWMNGDYVIDPMLNYIESHAIERPEVHYLDIPGEMGRQGPCGFLIENYYDRLGLGEEATYVCRTSGKLISFSLYKHRDSAPFSASQRDLLRSISAFLLKSVEHHIRLMPMTLSGETHSLPSNNASVARDTSWATTRSDKFNHLRDALLLDECRLTRREAEICAYIVMGYTAYAISLLLDISVNTVATHRKRAYSKLIISSQTELFDVCLKYCI